jgi:hypothetical protein
MILTPLTDENFLLYCAQVYENPQCHSTDEFIEDLNHIKYIKKLITRYTEKGDLKERLILNHIMILNNIFGADHVSRILYLKLKEQFHCIKPFLILLSICPNKLYNIGNEKVVDLALVPMDIEIIKELRAIKNGNS